MEPINLLEKYQATEQILMKEFNRFVEKHPKTDINQEFGLKTGDIILFKNGYDVPMISKILGFDKDGDAYMLWDCYWSPIKLSSRLIQKID